jgi:antitoxin (DNA-binding transcriptional repressor) of toxin-antitoxin stability system
MTIISVTKVRHDWPRIANGISKGESFLLQKRGQNLAMIVPYQETTTGQKSNSANALKGTASFKKADILSPETADWLDA